MALILSWNHLFAEDSPQWLTYPGGEEPRKGKQIVPIAAEREYRSEQSMPMMARMARILSNPHGFDCTVLFGVNEKGEVDPTMPVHPDRVFQSTMGSGTDLQSAGLRRLIINAAYRGMEMESAITATRSVEIAGSYKPLESGFNDAELGVAPELVSAYQ
jgi:hypothetical protein